MTFTLAHAGLIANNDQEILLHASVVQVKVGSSEYKMPDAIDVSVYSGNLGHLHRSSRDPQLTK